MAIQNWLPPEWSKAIVPIAIPNGEGKFTPIGTGFLFNVEGFWALITAKHVVYDSSGPVKNLVVLNNKKGGGIVVKPFDFGLRYGVNWFPHPTMDIAVTVIPINNETDDLWNITEKLVEEFSSIQEGEDVFLLVFL